MRNILFVPALILANKYISASAFANQGFNFFETSKSTRNANANRAIAISSPSRPEDTTNAQPSEVDRFLPTEDNERPRRRCPFGFLYSSEVSYNYTKTANPEISLSKLSGRWEQMATTFKFSLLSKLLPSRITNSENLSSGTRKIKSFDPEWVARAYHRIYPTRSMKSNEIHKDGDMRWELSKHAAKTMFLSIVKAIGAGDHKIIQVADHFLYHKYYGKFRLEPIMGLSVDLRAGRYLWKHVVDDIMQEFTRVMDFILRGGCTKKNTRKMLAAVHRNFDIPEEFLVYIASMIRDSISDACDEADLAAFDAIFITDLARTGLVEGSKKGYLN